MIETIALFTLFTGLLSAGFAYYTIKYRKDIKQYATTHATC
ncbi:MAG: hypothetical protein ACQCN4_02015 [Candidatus Bathyarchaeia archaeon]